MENSEVGGWVLQTMESNQEAKADELGQFDRIFNIFSGTLRVVVDILLVILDYIGFRAFLVAKASRYVGGIQALVPPGKKDRIAEVINKTNIPTTAGLLGRYWI